LIIFVVVTIFIILFIRSRSLRSFGATAAFVVLPVLLVERMFLERRRKLDLNFISFVIYTNFARCNVNFSLSHWSSETFAVKNMWHSLVEWQG
jgi:hypothetical protein